MEALVRGGRHSSETVIREVDLLSAEAADAVYKQTKVPCAAKLAQGAQIVQTSGGGLVMDHGDMSERIGIRHCRIQPGRHSMQIGCCHPRAHDALVIDPVPGAHLR